MSANSYIDDFETQHDIVEVAHAQTNMAGSIFLLCATTLGAGLLGIPDTFYDLGIPLGLILLLIVSITNSFSIWMMLKASEVSSAKTYDEMAKKAFPRFGSIITSIFLLLLIFGALTSFMVIIGGILGSIVEAVTDVRAWYTHPTVLLFIFTVICIFPLCLLRNISKLEYSSFLAVVIIIFFTGVLIYKCIYGMVHGQVDWGKLHYKPYTTFSFFNALPVITVAYTCQFNVFPIWSELESPTLKRMNIVQISSTFLSALLYMCAGFFGYTIYPDTKSVDGNVLGSLDTSIFSTVIRCFFLLAILFHYPVVHFSFRQLLEKILFSKYEHHWLRHTIETIIIISCTMTLAILIPKLTTVFGVTGAVAGFPICFILPALCYIRLVVFEFSDDVEEIGIPFNLVNIGKLWKKLLLPCLVLFTTTVIMLIAIWTSVSGMIDSFKS